MSENKHTVGNDLSILFNDMPMEDFFSTPKKVTGKLSLSIDNVFKLSIDKVDDLANLFLFTSKILSNKDLAPSLTILGKDSILRRRQKKEC